MSGDRIFPSSSEPAGRSEAHPRGARPGRPSTGDPHGRRLAAVPVLAALAVAPLVGQADPVDDFIHAQMAAQNIPGLSLAVLRDGEVLKTAAYGLADRDSGAPATPETVYRIASVSKPIIALGVLLLADEGRLALDDPVTRYLEGAPATWEGITIRHLLTHTSGLIREGPGFEAGKVKPDAEVIRSAYDRPLVFEPGARWEYSNLGYFALADIIRVASGRPWPEFFDEGIFEPLGMASTWPTNTDEPVTNRATGYTDNDRLIPGRDWPALRPSGAFLSTVLDLAKLDAALADGRLLADSTRRAMWTPVTLGDGSPHSFGLGWQLAEVNGRRVAYHTGGMSGFRAGFARLPDDRLSVIVLMNLDDVDVHTILFGVARLYLSESGSEAGRSGLVRGPRPSLTIARGSNG